MYLYHTTIYKNPDAVGVDENDHPAWVTDFEVAAKRDVALKVTTLQISETTFEIEGEYDWFNGTVVDGTTIVWADVRYTENDNTYRLYITTDNPI